MRILVTGKSGQVSQSLQMIGAETKHEIITIGRPEHDFLKPDNLQLAIIKSAPDIVINAAAYTMVDLAESDSKNAEIINAKAPAIIARACKEIDIPLIHISTDYVYSGNKGSPYTEDDETTPQTIYGKTKLEGENAIAFIHHNHIILRTAWVYSPFGKNFVKTMLELAKTRDEVSIVCDQFGCPTYAIDIARALMKIAQRLKDDNSSNLRGVFHLTGSRETNWAEFAKAIFEFSSNDMKINKISSNEYKTPAKRPHDSRLDCTKLSSNYTIKLPLWEDSLKECLNMLNTKAK